jgi:hypothetical protein
MYFDKAPFIRLLILCIVLTLTAGIEAKAATIADFSARAAVGESFSTTNNTSPSLIVAIDTRDSGFNAIYLNVAIPSQGCTNEDRVIIDTGNTGGLLMFSTALGALKIGKQVSVRVVGCVSLNPTDPLGASMTAPRVVRVSTYP